MRAALQLCAVMIATALSVTASSQEKEDMQWRAFPVTDYFVDLNDSTRIVQVLLPDGMSFQEKQQAVIRGVYQTSTLDTVLKGYGKCHLIKGDYYYFAITGNKSGIPVKEGDLLYTRVRRQPVYEGQLNSISTHYIRFTDVYDETFCDPYNVLSNWTSEAELQVLDTMVKDIRFTGQYFTDNNPSMDVLIKTGEYRNRKVLSVMMACTVNDLSAFLDYVKARPLLYAGGRWKISEVFATWLSEGAPMVVR